ncbi:MAG: type I-F CRISPR-associated helicase Cas3f [Selenomonadaceae bacterium]|nr:type I-F CRISPR-associated helicase Cas3f [Selenomonadaceae bacterium]
MMVIFTSRSEKKSLASTRRILDSFADRIGNDTWKTIITEAGLAMVKNLLRKNATKSTAVACHWIRSRSRSELLWIVGNKDKFNSDGIVPVNTTSKDLRHGDWENAWEYLPLMKAVTAVAGLLHDWGKANDHFQEKLKKKEKLADPLRHEWMSCCLIAALIGQAQDCDTDNDWLTKLAEGTWTDSGLVKAVSKMERPQLENMPPLAQMVCWLILSHHRLPLSEEKLDSYSSGKTTKETMASMLASIDADWGYSRPDEPGDKCRKFSNGLLQDSEPWMKQLKKWSARLLKEQAAVKEIQSLEKIRPFLSYCRLALMLGDYYASSQEKREFPEGKGKLFANTDKHGTLKQQLDEHLLLVAEQALKIVHALPRLAEKMEKADNVSTLRHRSPADFSWQDDAVSAIRLHRKENDLTDSNHSGWFIVNLASTGRGKTYANAKIMRAISPDGDSLRYILALGLRSLTLQTGDEYRQRIGLDAEKMAVIIGSTAVSELHKKAMEETDSSEEDLLGAELADYEGYTDEFLDIFFSKSLGNKSKKNRAFLYRPVLVSTIDHLMGATETKRGGRYILPFLRLMSSDLVIDEIDDFSPGDLMAISRLVHLAGMLGRSVAISSATIPPDLAKGLFKAYRSGWNCFAQYMSASAKLSVLWCDEFSAKAETVSERSLEEAGTAFENSHNLFVKKRIKKLRTEAVRRKGTVIDCGEIKNLEDSGETGYYRAIADSIISLHNDHHVRDRVTGKKISLGLVRMANIDPCAALGKYLAGNEWPDGYTVKVMVYHSRQVLLMRHEQEKYLDSVLKRKGEKETVAITDPVLRHHIDNAAGENVLFVVVATPVEEVGRDHDFDWAVVEPSSYRSIIQLAGRVQRHRPSEKSIEQPNVAILQYNVRGMRGDKRAYTKPGFETPSCPLRSHDFKEIADVNELERRIDAVPRIEKQPDMDKDSLIGIEHLTMERFQDTTVPGPQAMRGWLQEYWWLTAFPQSINKFRDGRQEIKLCRMYKDGDFIFSEQDVHGEWIDSDRSGILGITVEEDDSEACAWWLDRSYIDALEKNRGSSVIDEERRDKALKKISLRYGEISIPENYTGKYYYSDQLGLYKKRGEKR